MKPHEIQLKGRHGYHRISEMDDSGIFVIIDHDHHKVHEGNFYILDNIQDDVDIASPKFWLFITPNSNTRVHIYFKGNVSDSGTFQLFEGVTVSANGNTIDPVNLNRNSSNTSEMQFYVDPTVTDEGTFIMGVYLGAASPMPTPIGGAAERQTEMILKKNTKYLVKFSPDSDNTVVSISFRWYEGDYPSDT